MSEENVEVVRAYIDAVNAFMRGELSSEVHAESFDPQCELLWHDQRTYPDTPQHLMGASEVIAFAEKFRDDWIDVVQEPLELIQAPDGRVLAFIRQRARGGKATFRSISTSLRSGRSEMEGCADSSTSAIVSTPSKPPVYRSRRCRRRTSRS